MSDRYSTRGLCSLAPFTGKRSRDVSESTEIATSNDDWGDVGRQKRAKTPGVSDFSVYHCEENGAELVDSDYLSWPEFGAQGFGCVDGSSGLAGPLESQLWGWASKPSSIQPDSFEFPDNYGMDLSNAWAGPLVPEPQDTMASLADFLPMIPAPQPYSYGLDGLGYPPSSTQGQDPLQAMDTGLSLGQGGTEPMSLNLFAPNVGSDQLQNGIKHSGPSDDSASLIIEPMTLDSVVEHEPVIAPGSPILETTVPVKSHHSEDAEYDTCFGVVSKVPGIISFHDMTNRYAQLKVEDEFTTSKPLEDATTTNVAITTSGSIGMIMDAESGVYRGLISKSLAEGLRELKTICAVTFSASVKAPNALSIVVYGLGIESDTVCDILVEHDLYLQLPTSFDTTVPYQNPQSFSLPADKETALDMPVRETKTSSTAKAMVLDSVAKSKINELLDSATGPEEFRKVQASSKLVTKLMTFQKKALAMMVEKESGKLQDTEFPSVWTEDPSIGTDSRFRNNVTGKYDFKPSRLCLGGLLADDMGLGKTLTILTLIAGSLSEATRTTRKGKSTLIVAPLSTLSSWKDQILKHFNEGSLTFTIFHGQTRRKQLEKIESYDIVLTTYETLKADCPHAAERKRIAMKDRIFGSLHEIKWHRVVLDEAHVIRNRSSQSFKAVYALAARHRWCLTGTPIQNTIEDLGSLVSFLRVAPFDEAYTFRSLFVQSYSTGETNRWKRLRALVRAISLRRTKSYVGKELKLSPRKEYVELVSLDPHEQAFYTIVKKRFASAIPHHQSSRNCFQLILKLRQICDHGIALLPEADRDWMQKASIYAPELAPVSFICENCGTAIADESNCKILSCFHQICLACLQARNSSGQTYDYPACPICSSSADNMDHKPVDTTLPPEALSPIPGPEDYSPSSKVKALLRNLTIDQRSAQSSRQDAPKSVIFSSWTRMLDLIGQGLSKRGIVYQRLDGTKSLTQRERALKQFRSDLSCEVLLATLGAGGVGLDLTVASRIHLMEPTWNPMLERQALDRVHRLGQTKDVVSRCYVVQGLDSIELYILEKQKEKLRMASSSFGGSTDRDDEYNNSIIQGFGTIICQ